MEKKTHREINRHGESEPEKKKRKSNERVRNMLCAMNRVLSCLLFFFSSPIDFCPYISSSVSLSISLSPLPCFYSLRCASRMSDKERVHNYLYPLSMTER